MSIAPEPKFEQFDQKVADSFVTMNAAATGLPQYLGIQLTEMTPGRLIGKIEVRQELLTPFGTLHGGVMAGFIDHMLGCVAYPHMKPGQWAATTEFKLNYLASVKGGELIAEARIVSLTRRFGVVAMEVVNEGRLVCSAQGTFTITDPKP